VTEKGKIGNIKKKWKEKDKAYSILKRKKTDESRVNINKMLEEEKIFFGGARHIYTCN
jgi:hypothetical protein